MSWRWWRRQPDGKDATEAERQAKIQFRQVRVQGLRVDRAISRAEETIRQADLMAREMERALRPRGWAQ